ncbi:hypothetical protein PILCRDRAFT_826030 [Piloderma croceum F 1598]|uniref:Uncharacterized protein n=1 Tax=Piloderma croceum (strain F 1598) TaxID=765440 RepID=A0A0C3ASB8_PILCF|nr:hypothetical protein PILCRDRAFT_826030 [Piloderma croceum F 1598]
MTYIYFPTRWLQIGGRRQFVLRCETILAIYQAVAIRGFAFGRYSHACEDRSVMRLKFAASHLVDSKPTGFSLIESRI